MSTHDSKVAVVDLNFKQVIHRQVKKCSYKCTSLCKLLIVDIVQSLLSALWYNPSCSVEAIISSLFL